MGLKRFLRFLNSERGQLPASEAARFKRAEESFTQTELPPGQNYTVFREGQGVIQTTSPQAGDIQMVAGRAVGLLDYDPALAGGIINFTPLSATQADAFTEAITGQTQGPRSTGSSFSSSTSFNVSEVGPIAAQIQREELALQERRIEQETAIANLQSQIELGKVDINAALTQYDQFLTGQRLRLDASEFAVAPGTQFAPGFAPGDIASQVAESAGLAPSAGVAPITPVTISSGTPPNITPLAESAPIQDAFEQLQQFGL